MTMLPAETVERFESTFGGKPTHAAVAPGRINLIGEHTDYHGGFVLPVAINRSVTVAARVTDQPSRLVSANASEIADFDAADAGAATLPNWGKYPAGVAWALSAKTGRILPNILGSIGSDLPLGSGLSSSAAIEMAFATLWRLITPLDLSDGDLALAGQRAENEFVGMNCGIMDQTASLFGQAGAALFVDTLHPERPEPLSLPPDLALMVCDTNVKHELASSAYNLRRQQSESAAAKLGVRLLREVDLNKLESEKGKLTDVEYRRARHIITENARVVAFRDALIASHQTELGPLMLASHESLRTDYEVSCPELDAMAAAAREHPACVGARMMGGGFGGACIALVDHRQAEDFSRTILQRYFESTGIQGALLQCEAVDGARAWAIERTG
jgi:galactokinase